MWVIQGDWILQLSKCTSFMLDGAYIRVYWDANKDPDIINFKDDETAKVEFDKIVKGIAGGKLKAWSADDVTNGKRHGGSIRRMGDKKL